MPQQGSPQLRVRATVVVVLYACILVGGALLQHASLCSNTVGPHCALCACVNSVSLVRDLTPPCPDSHAAVRIVASAQSSVTVLSESEIGSRAPPAAVAVTHNSTDDPSTSVRL
jgi:hypothetical protein